MKPVKQLFYLCCLLFASVWPMKAQEEYLMEIGAGGGTGFYMGDANTVRFYKNCEMAYGFLWAYHFNPRYSVKVDLQQVGISGNTRQASNAFPEGRNVAFRKSVYDLSGVFEYNFSAYGYKLRDAKRFTPYIYAGLGMTLGTGEGSTCWGINIPFGVGVKYKIAPRLNIGLDFTMHKLFSDRLDEVKNGELLLDDPYKIKSSWLKNKDWYSVTFIYISYDFLSKVRRCNSN